MSTQIQSRRGSTTEHSTFTGAAGELTVDTTKKTVVVHDGQTAGGYPLVREDSGQFTGNVEIGTGIDLSTGGTATFTDSVNVMPASGVTRVNLTASTGEIFCATDKTDATAMVRIQGGRGGAGQNDNVVLNADGSASFANKIDLDVDEVNFRKGVRCNPDTEGTSFISVFGTGGSNVALQVYDGVAGTDKFRVYHDGSATFGGVLQGDQRVVINGAGGKSGSQATFLNYAGDGTTDTIEFTADGAATFAGKLTVNNGSEITATNSQFASTVLSRWTSDHYSAGTTVITFNGDGSAAFAGKVSAGGTYETTERTITAGSFDLATGNHWTCGAITVPAPTNATVGTSGLIRITAGPAVWNSVFKFPGGAGAPTIAAFPAIIPFYVKSSSEILMGNVAEGIA